MFTVALFLPSSRRAVPVAASYVASPKALRTLVSSVKTQAPQGVQCEHFTDSRLRPRIGEMFALGGKPIRPSCAGRGGGETDCGAAGPDGPHRAVRVRKRYCISVSLMVGASAGSIPRDSMNSL